MIELAVIGDEVAQDCALVADTAAQLGFAAVEIRSVDETPPHLLTDRAIDDVRDVLAARSLAVAGFAAPVFKSALPVTDDDDAAAADMLVGCGRRATRLGSPHLRVFTFYRDGDPDPKRAAAAVARVLGDRPLPVPLVVETGTRTNTPTMGHLLTFLDALGRDDIGILWDPGNSVFSGWDATPFPGDLDAGFDRIRHVHVKDPNGTEGYVRLGDGDLDWARIVERLGEAGYDGYLSLETHWRHGRLLTQAQRDEPWGEEFSRDGYAASVECMQRLNRWVDRLSGVSGS